jgi:hypothetical protein
MAYAFDASQIPILLDNTVQTIFTCSTVEWHGMVRLVNKAGASRTVTVWRHNGGTDWELLYAYALAAGEVYEVKPVNLANTDLIKAQLASGTGVIAFVQGVKGP